MTLAASTLCGCQSFSDVTGSIPPTAAPKPVDVADVRAQTDDLQKRYERSPGEKVASIEYARSLRALSRYNEAVAVMQAAAVKTPKDLQVLGEYGKALADSGQLGQAKDVLTRAYTPDNPKWDVMSVQGSVADRLGDHEAAMQFYSDALKIAPGEPSILTNLGLSYALAKQLPAAERALKQAAASPNATSRTRGDLALVLALQGKYSEAETVARSDLAPEDARADVETIRRITVGGARGEKSNSKAG